MSSMRGIGTTLAAAAALWAGTAFGQGGVMLVQDGRAMAVLVLPDGAGADSTEQAAADILSSHLRQMSGADLEILREGELRGARVEGGRVVVAPPRARRVPDDDMFGDEHIPGEGRGRRAARAPRSFVLVGEGELAKGLGVSAENLGVGGIRVKAAGNALALIGGPTEGPGVSDPHGLRNAAIEVLEQLGCRYLWPGELGKVVPERRTVTVPFQDLSYTPPVSQRHIRMRYGLARIRTRREARGLAEWLGMTEEEWMEGFRRAAETESPVLWTEWQRLGDLRGFIHNGAGLGRGEHRGLQEQRPEWFALQGDGTRDNTRGRADRWRLCKSNPEWREFVAERIIRLRDENPELTLVSLCPNDGSFQNWCLCDDCRALDPPDAPRITFRIAEQIGADHPLPPPAVRLEVEGSWRTGPRAGLQRSRIEYPSLTDRTVHYWNAIAERVAEQHPDLLFGVSAYSAFSHAPVRETLHPNLVVRYVPATIEEWEGWEQAGARRVFWRPNILLMGRTHGKLQSIAGRMARNMRYFAERGMNQTDFDSIYHNWATFGMAYYATARLNWNPYLSAEEILDDYARHGFGAGAEQVKRFFLRVEELTDEGVHAGHEAPDDYRYTPDVMAELRGLLGAAEEAAGDEEVAARIAFLRLGLNMTELWERLDDKARRREDGEAVDMVLARRLMDLNALALRDIVANHHFAVFVPGVTDYSARFAAWHPLERDAQARVRPSDEALMERVQDPRYGLTGRERSLDEMLAAFGL